MVIAIVYGGYLPGEKYGGPVTSIYNLTELLGDNNSIYIICSNHDLKETKPYEGIHDGWNIVGKVKVLYLYDNEFSRKKFAQIADEIQPSMIYVSSLFSARQTMPALNLSKKKRIPLLLAPRGELNEDALSIKSKKKKIYLLYLKLLRKLSHTYFQATSEEEKRNIKNALNIKENRIFYLPNVPTLPNNKEKISKNPGIVKVCFVGRIVQNKNLIIALKAIVSVKAKVIFDIFGPLEDKDYWNECLKIIEKAPENVKITYQGAVSAAQINDAYKNYDCLVSPTRFENYGQSIVEAMLHDVPVVLSEGTTPWDEIKDYEVGYLSQLNDTGGYTRAIEDIASMDSERYYALVLRLRNYCAQKFDYETLENQYRNVFSVITG